MASDDLEAMKALSKVVDQSRLELDKLNATAWKMDQEMERNNQISTQLLRNIKSKRKENTQIENLHQKFNKKLIENVKKTEKAKANTPRYRFMKSRLTKSVNDLKSKNMILEQRVKEKQKSVNDLAESCNILDHEYEMELDKKDNLLIKLKERRRERCTILKETTKKLTQFARVQETMFERELERKRIAIGSIEHLRKQQIEAAKRRRENETQKKQRLAKEKAVLAITTVFYENLWKRLTKGGMRCETAQDIVERFLLMDETSEGLRDDISQGLSDVEKLNIETSELELELNRLTESHINDKRDAYSKIDIAAEEVEVLQNMLRKRKASYLKNLARIGELESWAHSMSMLNDLSTIGAKGNTLENKYIIEERYDPLKTTNGKFSSKTGNVLVRKLSSLERELSHMKEYVKSVKEKEKTEQRRRDELDTTLNEKLLSLGITRKNNNDLLSDDTSSQSLYEPEFRREDVRIIATDGSRLGEEKGNLANWRDAPHCVSNILSTLGKAKLLNQRHHKLHQNNDNNNTSFDAFNIARFQHKMRSYGKVEKVNATKKAARMAAKVSVSAARKAKKANEVANVQPKIALEIHKTLLVEVKSEATRRELAKSNGSGEHHSPKLPQVVNKSHKDKRKTSKQLKTRARVGNEAEEILIPVWDVSRSNTSHSRASSRRAISSRASSRAISRRAISKRISGIKTNSLNKDA